MINKHRAKDAAKEFMTHFHPDRKWWIVGGLLRDTELWRPAKDIDIFISGYNEDLLPEGCEDFGDRNAYLLRAYTVKAYPYKGQDYEINLIFMRGDFWTLEKMTDRCDFGICQIGYDPLTGETYRSDKYKADVANKTITMSRDTTQNRINRMREKFPEFEFQNPDDLDVNGKKSWCYNPETQLLQIVFDKVKPV